MPTGFSDHVDHEHDPRMNPQEVCPCGCELPRQYIVSSYMFILGKTKEEAEEAYDAHVAQFKKRNQN